jgi:hypothetical protein
MSSEIENKLDPGIIQNKSSSLIKGLREYEPYKKASKKESGPFTSCDFIVTLPNNEDIELFHISVSSKQCPQYESLHLIAEWYNKSRSKFREDVFAAAAQDPLKAEKFSFIRHTNGIMDDRDNSEATFRSDVLAYKLGIFNP